MKPIFLFLLLLMFNTAHAQNTNHTFPFNLYTLSTQKAYSVENILPRIEGDTFYYFNLTTGKKVFNNNFEEAYPFIGKCALVKANGKYGIIDLKGNYIIEPTYIDYDLPPYEDECHLIIFTEDFIFDLNAGTKSDNGYIICEEPAVPEFRTFTLHNKYGIKNNTNETIIEAKYDSVIDIHFDFFVLKLNNNIGVINAKNETIIDFKYEEATFSRDDYYTTPQTIGLKKGNTWTYFELPKSTKNGILSSKHQCFQMHALALENAIDVFKKRNRFNILFKNGKKLNKYYNWISNNGLVGTRNKVVYFINQDGSSNLYYKE